MSRKEIITDLVICGMVLAAMYYGHIYIAFCILFGLGIIRLAPLRGAIFDFLKNAYVLRFYNVVIWFFSYLIALKILSFASGVSEDDLKYSPAILGVPVSVLLVWVLIMLASALSGMIVSVYSQFSPVIPGDMKQSIESSGFMLLLRRGIYLMILTAPLPVLAVFSTPWIARVALLADASFISPCGAKAADRMYLKINDTQCYRFTLDRHLLTRDPVIQEMKSAK